MNPRTIRRAAERQAAKLARKNPIVPTAAAPVSAAKIAANQANAQLSCGPKTEIGKLVSSHNALKTGLTGRTVLLPTDDVAAYQTLLDAYLADFKPATSEERELVQSIVDCTWRMKRIMNLEFGIYLKGSLEFADEFPDLEPAARGQMIQVETYLKYEKSIRNLNTQEARLHRRLLKDTIELKRIQSERRQQEHELPAEPEVGFDFSTGPIPSENPPLLQPVAPVALVATAGTEPNA